MRGKGAAAPPARRRGSAVAALRSRWEENGGRHGRPGWLESVLTAVAGRPQLHAASASGASFCLLIRGVGGGRTSLGCKSSGHIYEDNVVAGHEQQQLSAAVAFASPITRLHCCTWTALLDYYLFSILHSKTSIGT